MDELGEIEKRTSEADQKPPIAHIALLGPGGELGKLRALCGADVLGIPAFGEYVVCPRCVELKMQRGII
jgi:hypothetical protein